MKVLRIVVTMLLAAAVFLFATRDLIEAERSAAATPVPAELVLEGGVIHTLDPELPRAASLAVRGGRIVGISTGAPDPKWIGPGTRRIELSGACVVPGLWDAHAHLLSLGMNATRVDLAGTRSFRQVIRRVVDRALKTPRGDWIVGRGWDQNDWPGDEFNGEFPTHDRLTSAVPDHPVVLYRIDGHALVLNAAGIKASGITAASKAPRGGAILRDARGQPTGVLVDAAMSLARGAGRRPSPIQIRNALRLAARQCLRLGLVGVHAAGVGLGTLRAYEGLYEAGELPLRVYAMLRPGAARALWRRGEGPRVGAYGGRLTVRSVKRFMDGALGSRGAALLAPYSDAPGSRGLPQLEVEDLAAFTREALERGFQVCTHAIGDAGVRRTLDAYQRAQGPRRDARLRVEHAQVIAPADIPRFAQLGILPSMQPTHATSDMPWAEARLGPQRVRGAYAWRSLLQAGVRHLPLSSDFPVEAVNPLLGIYAAVTRCAPDGTSPHGPGGWYPAQALTRVEALAGFTREACFAGFMEREGGTLQVGKWADIAVFDRDLLTCPPRELLRARALYTIVAGEVAYEADPRQAR